MSNTLFARTARKVAEPFVVPYTGGAVLGLVVVTYWMIEYWFNMGGIGAFATFSTILTSLAILLFGLKPLYVAYAGEVGVIISAVSLKDPRVGAAKAVVSYFRFVLWLVLANLLVGLALGTIVFGKAFEGDAWVFPNLFLLVWAAVTFGYLVSSGAGLKKMFITIFLVLILGILAWKWIGPDNREAVASRFKDGKEAVTGFASSGADSVVCSDHVPLVEHGMRITVAVGCPVKVDQKNMVAWIDPVTKIEHPGGTDFKLVDPALRAVTGRQQLVTMDPDNTNRFVTLQANAEGLRRYGRTAVEVELYRDGTGDAEVARRYGVVTPNIDLTPAR